MSKLLMIPGPIEISPKVQEAFAVPPPGHLAPPVIEAFGRSLERMREVWLAGKDSVPFILAGGGTAAMEMAAANLVECGDRVVVACTGYFSDRMSEMLRRLGAEVIEVRVQPGRRPEPGHLDEILEAETEQGPVKALFATHVDTSTGVRIDAGAYAAVAQKFDLLSIFDGVCATAAEEFRMEEWGADVYLTASQKAIGLPPGLALLVASPRAAAARSRLKQAPPMYLDWDVWRPIMDAYEARKPAYFSTPATNLILALDAGLGEILEQGMDARFALHAGKARELRERWEGLGLTRVPEDDDGAANTLSALYYPEGVDASLVGRIGERGVIVAGGLHPEIRDRYFRVGHMGYAMTQPEMLERTVSAIADALGVRSNP